MAISQLPQSPYRQDRKIFPTPLATDVLFSEVIDCSRIEFPEYGTPHPNKVKWPNHKLILIKTVDIERDGIFEFFYAADRENQDEYNWEFSEADLGGVRFPSVNRTYVILREEFDSENPSQGDVMVNVPENVFDGEYVLSSRIQKRTEEQLDSIFVVEQRTYVKKSAISGFIYDEKTGRGIGNTVTLYYADEIVEGENTASQLFLDDTNPYWGLQSDGTFRKGQQLSTEWYQVDSQSIIPANSENTEENPAKTRIVTRNTPFVSDVLFSETGSMPDLVPEYGSAHYDTISWPSHKLVLIRPVDASGLLFEFFYAADRENQDTYNFSYGNRSIVGAREFRVVLREYIIPRSEFDPLYPAFQSPMPNVPEDVFEDIEYVFYDKTQKKIDQPELDSVYIAEVRTYIESAFLDYKLSYSAQVPDLVPEKFRASITQVATEGIEVGLAALPELEAGQLQASEDQLNPYVKVVKSVARAKPTSNVTLLGSRSYVEATDAVVEETYSTNELQAETGLLVSQSIASPLGDGTFVRETIRVESWPELTSTEWDPTINAQVVSKEQFVSPDSVDTAAPYTSHRAVNKDRTLRTVEVPPDDALLNYRLAFPSRMDIQLPNVLRSINIVWSTANAEGSSDGEWEGQASGTSYSLSGSEGDDCMSSASIKPELVVDIQQSWGSDIPITAYAFFIKTNNGSVTESELKARITAVVGITKPWPLFKPVSHTLIAVGGSVVVKASASGSASRSVSGSSSSAERGTSKSESYDVGLNVNAIPIPATIHGPINMVDYSQSIMVRAEAQAKWNGTNFPSLDVKSTAQHSAYGSITPSFLPATTPSSIPNSGLYVMRTSLEPYKWGWAKCSAIILDASNLA